MLYGPRWAGARRAGVRCGAGVYVLARRVRRAPFRAGSHQARVAVQRQQLPERVVFGDVGRPADEAACHEDN